MSSVKIALWKVVGTLASVAAQQIATLVLALVLFGLAWRSADIGKEVAALGIACLASLGLQYFSRWYGERHEPHRTKKHLMKLRIGDYGNKVTYLHRVKFEARHSGLQNYTIELLWTGKTSLSDRVSLLSSGCSIVVEEGIGEDGRPTGSALLRFTLDQPLAKRRCFTIAFEVELDEKLGDYKPQLVYNGLNHCHSLLARLELAVQLDRTVVLDTDETCAREYRTPADTSKHRSRNALKSYLFARLLKRDEEVVFRQRPIDRRLYVYKFPVVSKPKVSIPRQLVVPEEIEYTKSSEHKEVSTMEDQGSF